MSSQPPEHYMKGINLFSHSSLISSNEFEIMNPLILPYNSRWERYKLFYYSWAFLLFASFSSLFFLLYFIPSFFSLYPTIKHSSTANMLNWILCLIKITTPQKQLLTLTERFKNNCLFMFPVIITALNTLNYSFPSDN